MKFDQVRDKVQDKVNTMLHLQEAQVLNCTISRSAEKRQRTAALQEAAALSEAPRQAVRFWSAAVLCRFSIAFQRSQAPRRNA